MCLSATSARSALLSESEEHVEPNYLALDLGSNSFHLLLATFREGKMVRLDRRKETVRLASGLGEDGQLSLEAQERALNCLQGFRSLVVDLPASRVRAVGTNTMRAARNSIDFLRRAEASLGHSIDIISGIEEARLIYLGVSRDLATGDGQRLVVDIGGGSTEVVLGDTAPRRLESLYMGCVSYSQRFFPEGKLRKNHYRKALRAAQSELLGLAGQFGDNSWQEAVGSSGTIRAIGSVLAARGYQAITLAGLHEIRDELLSYDNFAEINLPGLSADRSMVIAGGLAILDAIFQELDIETMQVSDYAIREGIIHDLAGRFHHRDKRQETLEGLMRDYHVDVKQAQRVGNLAATLWTGLDKVTDPGDCEMLRWAANLHEIGLSISHAGYQRHGAYILQHADLPGFSRQEQQHLGFLILNHRRRIKPPKASYGFEPDWPMVLCLRLACVFARSRRDNLPSILALKDTGELSFLLGVEERWLADHPLEKDDLAVEARHWKRAGYTLEIRGVGEPMVDT